MKEDLLPISTLNSKGTELYAKLLDMEAELMSVKFHSWCLFENEKNSRCSSAQGQVDTSGRHHAPPRLDSERTTAHGYVAPRSLLRRRGDGGDTCSARVSDPARVRINTNCAELNSKEEEHIYEDVSLATLENTIGLGSI